MNLSELILNLMDGQIAEATFVNDKWQVIKSFGFIRYYEDGKIGEAVKLTYSNIRAEYKIIE